MDSIGNGSSVVVIHCAQLRYGINSTRLVFSLKSETERKECGGDKASEKVIKIRKKRFEKYHVPDIRELEKAKGPEVIDVDASVENTMVVFLAIKELRKDTEEGWKKLTVPLDQVIEANNASNVGLKKRDVQLARWEDIMDGRVCANCVKIDELRAKVTLVILDALVEY